MASPSLKWAAWGERDVELLVLAYHDTFGLKPIAGALSVDDALDMSANAWNDAGARRRFAREFARNYGDGQEWNDPSPARAMVIARDILNGHLGIVEGCRRLIGFQHEFPKDWL